MARSAKLTYAEPASSPPVPQATSMPAAEPMSTKLPPEVTPTPKVKGNAPMRGTRNVENELPPAAFHTGRR